MKKRLLLIFFIALFLQSCISPKNYPNKPHVWLDENGKEVIQKEFKNKWGKDDGFARWDKVEGKRRIASLLQPVYETFEGEYQGFRVILENLTNKEFSNNTTFLIEYIFKDDFCTSKGNNWGKPTTIERKKFLDPLKTEVENEYSNVVVLLLFQEGISYANTGSKTYFYTDKENKILINLFQEPARCGSFAIIKPDGNILVRNGEFRLNWMADFIQPEVWNKIFTE